MKIKTNQGIAEPIRYETKNFGLQLVDDGKLLGLILSDGKLAEPHSNGCLSWELCEWNEMHTQLIRDCVWLTSFNEFPLEADLSFFDETGKVA